MRPIPFVVAFATWTLIIWVGRLRNIWLDDDLTTAGQLGRSALAMTFVVGAVAVALVAWRATPPVVVKVVMVAGAWTTGVWAVRTVDVISGDWSVGFKVVHTGLAIVSVALAAAALREARDLPSRSEPSSGPSAARPDRVGQAEPS